jgi:hypothetical protein
MADQPEIEFGKRRPQRPKAYAAEPPPKRSSHVALLLMGTFAVGGAAYSLMGSQNCTPPSPGVAAPGMAVPGVTAPGVAAPAVPQPGTTSCTSRGSSGGNGGGGGYSGSSRYGLFSDSSSGHSSSSSSSSEAASSSVSRGGFGSFAHAFGFSGSG